MLANVSELGLQYCRAKLGTSFIDVFAQSLFDRFDVFVIETRKFGGHFLKQLDEIHDIAILSTSPQLVGHLGQGGHDFFVCPHRTGPFEEALSVFLCLSPGAPFNEVGKQQHPLLIVEKLPWQHSQQIDPADPHKSKQHFSQNLTVAFIPIELPGVVLEHAYMAPFQVVFDIQWVVQVFERLAR